MKRNPLVLAAILLSVMVGGVIWYVAPRQLEPESPSPNQQKQPPLVRVEAVQEISIARSLVLTGEVVPTNAAVITSMKEGRIEFCPWREGDAVQSGETLVTIDRDVHRAEEQAAKAALELAQAKFDDLLAGARPEEIQKAEANLRSCRATLDEARQSYQRQAALIEKEFTSQDAVDKTRERMDVAEADLNAAEDTLAMLKKGPTDTQISVQKATSGEAAARLALAEAHLAECVITAPFDGIISKVHVRPGDTASVRAPLVEIFDPSSLVIRFAVPEEHAYSVERGMTSKISLDAMPGKSLAGKITRVYPELDPAMRTRTVEASLVDSFEIVPHSFARLNLELTHADGTLGVPVEAVLVSPEGQRIAFVVEDGKAVRREISVGIEDGAQVQVLSGLKAGDKIAVAGNEQLRPGMPVRVAGDQAGAKPGGQGGKVMQQPGARKGAQP
jgi:multidrug resistance efflux pump